MTTAIALEWVPMNRYCELFGETPDAVDKRVRSGHLAAKVWKRSNALKKKRLQLLGGAGGLGHMSIIWKE